MKAILMSIKPQYVAKILNGEKTIEVRKRFPKDYVGWVYIYVTQNHKHAGWKNRDTLKRDSHDEKPTNHFQLWTDDMVEDKDKLNGKVVARFWCDKVEEIFTIGMYYHETKSLDKNELPRLSCLSCKDLDNYLQGENGYAIQITKAEPFDEPKEIKEFEHLVRYRNCKKCPYYGKPRECEKLPYCCEFEKIYKAPQSWCYIEI